MVVESAFDTGEIILNYAEGGTKGKPVMVFLHGLTGNWQAYTVDLEEYGQDWHIYALDLRGHGKSGKPETGYAIPDYAGDVIHFLRHKIGEPVCLVGHSTGALVTLATASMAPDMVRLLIANDPPLLGTGMGIDDFPRPKKWFSWVYETMKTGPDLEQVAEACKIAYPDAKEVELQAMAERVNGVAPGTVKNALEDQHLKGINLHEALSKIECPALLLYGDIAYGSVVRDQDAQAFGELVPQGVVRKVDKGSHMLWWEQMEITRKHVQEFFNSV